MTKKFKCYLDLEPICADRGSVKPFLTTDEIDNDATEINEDLLCSSANKLEREDECFCDNEEERDHCELPINCGRLK